MSAQGDTHRAIRHRWRRASTTVSAGAVVAGLLVLLPGQADAAGTTYTVNNDPAAGCSDTAPTTPTGPFCSISAAVAAAAKNQTSGDIIQVAAGTYSERVNVTESGITLTGPSTGPSNAIVDGGGTLPYGFNVTGSSVTIDGFTVQNQTTAGVNVNGGGSDLIQHVIARGSATNGIRVISADKVTVTHATVDGNARAGVLFQMATNSTVSSSEASANQREGVSIQGGSGDTVEGVTTHDNVNLGAGGRLAPGINVTFYTPTGGSKQVADSITVQRNVSFNNDDSGIQVYGASQNVTVRRNLAYDNGDHGIDFSMASQGAVVSNTVLRNFTAGINIESDGTSGALASVRDNLAMDNGDNSPRTTGDIRVDALSVAAGSSIDYDLVYDSTGQTVLTWGTTTYKSIDAFRAAVPSQEVHGKQGDPLLDSSNAPGAGSPAIDAADAGATGWTSKDLNGNPPVDDPTVADTGAGTPAYADLGAIERTNVAKNQPPVAVLTVTPSTVTAGGTVTLDASGSSDPEGQPLTYVFDCGDSTVTPVVSPAGNTATCTYPTAGAFTAKVTVTDAGGASASDTKQVTVSAPPNQSPTAALTAKPSTIMAGGTVTLDASGSKDSDGSIATYAFDCGLGTGSGAPQQAATTTCTYPTAGSYPAKVTVTDNLGATGTATATVTVNASGGGGGGGGGPVNTAPTAALTANPPSTTEGGTVTLDASGSNDSDGSIATYAFDCGLGTGFGAPQQAATTTCTYPTAGSFPAKVTVTDNGGLTDTATAAVTVTAAPVYQAPTAVLAGGRVRQGEPIRIDARGSHGNGGATIVSYLFRCAGDVIGPKPGARARCVFRRVGVHRVSVRVTDSHGRTDRAVARVRVVRGRPPVARLALSPDVVGTGELVVADASGSHGSRYSAIKAVRFWCGNGRHSRWRVSNVYGCRYAEPGRYTVTVVVRNTLGLRDVATETVRVRRG